MGETQASESDFKFICNIPDTFTTQDLRNYFSFLIEKEAFQCFHFTKYYEDRIFRKINEIKDSVSDDVLGKNSSKRPKLSDGDKLTNLLSTFIADRRASNAGNKTKKNRQSKFNRGESEKGAEEEKEKEEKKPSDTDTTSEKPKEEVEKEPAAEVKVEPEKNIKRYICLIKVKKELSEYMSFFHEKFWIDRTGTVLPSRCLVVDFDPEVIAELYGARDDEVKAEEIKDEEEKDKKDGPEETKEKKNLFNLAKYYTIKHLNNCSDLKPRPEFVIPRGNVGTPTRWFKTKMKDWNIEPSLFAELGIQYGRNRNLLRFTGVPFILILEECELLGQLRAFTDNGDVIPAIEDFRQIRANDSDVKFDVVEKTDLEAISEAEGYSKERSSENSFQTEISLKWEKSDSGLVYFTEGQFRRCMEGGEEERASEGWESESDPAKLGIEPIEEEEAGKKKKKLLLMNMEEYLRGALKGWSEERILSEKKKKGLFCPYYRPHLAKPTCDRGRTDNFRVLILVFTYRLYVSKSYQKLLTYIHCSHVCSIDCLK